MALRRFNKIMKPVAIIGFIGFIVASLYGGYTFINKNILQKNTTEKLIAVVNGEKVTEVEYVRAYEGFKVQLDNFAAQQKQQSQSTGALKPLPDDIVKKYILQNIIDQKLLLSSAKELKVGINGGEVDKKVEEVKAQFSGNEDSFISYLRSQGFNLTTFKQAIKAELTVRAVQDKIQTSLKTDDKELKSFYERYKYSDFEGQTYDQAKEQIKELYSKDYSGMLLNSFLNKKRDSAKIEFKNKEYKAIYDELVKTVYEKNGYKYTNRILNDRIVMAFANTADGYSDEMVTKLKENIKTDLDRIVAISEKAKAAGLKSDSEFTGIDELNDLSKKYYNHLVDTYKPSDAQMQQTYEANKENYNIQHSIAGAVVGDVYKAGKADEEVAKKKAEEILKTLTTQNFAAKAKEFSEDPGSAANGGSLGEEIDLTQLVPEFVAGVKATEKGKISKVIKSQFGYHIIYVQSKNPSDENKAKVSHILIIPKVTDAAKKDLETRLQTLMGELNSKKVAWDQVNTQDKYNYSVKEQFKKITEKAAIPGIGYDAEAIKQLFGAKVGQTVSFRSTDGYFLMVKTAETPFKAVSYAEAKDRVRLEMAFKYANDEIEKIK
ncbi:MAG: peptidylprolyl isomerase [Leptotrichiaceae bacterium]|jgi:parvulin-like peptidyl-prolyl isomerase|nr:peptidylprolyl isomerase [Leptotrichiaceae bacterium]MBP9538718.1 peptidylprolyl isomerase [Leptotrichiaceae bacterium]MBP9876006.1 peptidylprolyl isomerase [Leptotrichiaceae bacterium]